MPFTLDDFIHKIGAPESGDSRERVVGDNASVQTMDVGEIRDMFPDVQFSDSPNIIYFPMKLCHSLPTVNKKRRCFTTKTLANSFASAQDSLIDIEHSLIDNGISSRDEICGHIKAVAYAKEGLQWKEVADASSIPDSAVPLYALGALYMRHSKIPDIVKNHLTGREQWKVSMECGHKWSDAALYYRDEFIPFADADGDMLECVHGNGVKDYKGHEMAVALGGVDGKVSFWGAGITTSPADDTSDVLAMVAGTSLEVASSSSGKIFLPLKYKIFSGEENCVEVASVAVDTMINDLASIAIIGKTQPGDEDGHVHEILSDGTILPSNGHVHYLQNMNLVRGNKPKLTGRTDTHHSYWRDPQGTEHSEVHLHIVDVPLRGKNNSGDTVVPEEASLPGDIEVKFKDLFKKMEDATKKISSGNPVDEATQKEFASLVTEMRQSSVQADFDESVKSEIASQIEGGELMTKEQHETMLNEALELKQTEFDAVKASDEKHASRLKEISDIGVNLEYKFEEDDEETIEEQVKAMSHDEAGDKMFKRTINLLKQLAKAATSEEEVEEVEVVADTASVNKKVQLLVGAGSTEQAAETASTKVTKSLRGRSAISYAK